MKLHALVPVFDLTLPFTCPVLEHPLFAARKDCGHLSGDVLGGEDLSMLCTQPNKAGARTIVKSTNSTAMMYTGAVSKEMKANKKVFARADS